MTIYTITTEYITLMQLLKASNVAETGGHAKMLIEDGEVLVNDAPEFRKRKKLYRGDVVKVMEEEIKIG